MLNPNWKLDFKANTSRSDLDLEFFKDKTGWEENICAILCQDGNSIHINPESVAWIVKRFQDIMDYMEYDGFDWTKIEEELE